MRIPVDLLIRARRIYALDEAFSVSECMAVREGRVVATGTRGEIEDSFTARRILNLGDATVLPRLHGPAQPFSELRLRPSARPAFRREILGGDGSETCRASCPQP